MTGRERASAACFAAFTFLLALSFAGCQPVTTTNTATVNTNATNTNATNVNATNANVANANATNATNTNEATGASSSSAMSATPDKPNAVPTDTRVVVNAPAFRMDVFERGRLVKSYKVGIGYPEFPLPTGMRSAETIVFNPTWTPPDEPWVEAGASKVKVGEEVPAGDKLNPLGALKIPIGAPSLIHGGKNPARIGEFASHGCVGLTDQLVEDFALELARLGGTQLTSEDEQTYAKDKTETKAVKLAQPVAVELRYETIVATDDGVLHVYRDVYDRGTNTEENLRRVLEAHGVSFDELDEQTRAQLLDALRQMARDALGNPAEGGGTEVMNSNAKGANKNDNSSSKNASGAHVTRNVKGQKEIAIPVPQLQGKGYPVPVGDAFKNDQQNQQQKAGAAKKGKRR